ncbi:MAG: tyrosine-type recombinase/integrase [Enterobacterales bacterium]
MPDRKATRYPGVFYRESVKAIHNGKPDKSFCLCYNHHGKKYWQTVGWASRGITAAYAQQVRIEVLNKLNLGENPARLKRKKLFTIGQAVEAYFVWAKGEKRDIRRIVNLYNCNLQKRYGEMPIDMITLEDLDKFKAELAERVSNQTARHLFNIMQRAINFAIKRKHWEGINPLSSLGGFTMPKLDNKGERFLTPDEAARLLERLALLNPKWHDMALLSLHTGLRLTEIFGIQGRDIDEQNQVVIVTAKGRKREPVLLTPEALEILLRHRGQANDLLFGGRYGQRVVCVSTSFKTAVNDCGLNDGVTDRRHRVWFHTLRHTFASWLAQKGVDLYALMKLMRHKNVIMTQRYAHLIPDQQRKHLEIVRAVLSASADQSSLPQSQP